ncbi:MAG: UvrD-helicase domain-containing protein [Candidatus Contubernalis sp.]|nr:UvrD-helicase domain-containing protein [Candidatus Contubernalis sp.]
MNKSVLKDAAARERIRVTLDKNIMVEAGAGSGKTTCLIERMSALVVSGTCSVEKIAAITFTRKAAGELREKFQLELEKLLQKEKDQKIRERLSYALEKIDRAFLGTIHSFCGRLLRERPVEAGINPNFTEMKELEEELLAERCWQDYLLGVRLNKKKHLEKLEDMDLSLYDLKEAFFQLTYYPDVEIVREEVPFPDLNPAKKQLEVFLQLASKHLPGKEPKQGWDGLQNIIRLGLQFQRMFDLNDVFAGLILIYITR